jgi:predicted CoA-substrate-specific enzyme activase
MKCYLGIDVGSISTKGVVIDDKDKVLAESYLWTEGNPIEAIKRVLNEIKNQIKDKNCKVMSLGVTGSARELIGKILEAQIVKNEITAHALGTLSKHPDVKTILEIGGQDSKIILINNGIVVDYAMNTLCAAGTGAFLISQSKRLNIPIEEFGSYSLLSKNPSKLAGRCTVFAESDLVHKTQMGHRKEDLIAGICNSIVNNYLNNVGKGKKIESPIVFQGGVSKNIGVVKAFEKILKQDIILDKEGHLMGCIGAAILAKNSKKHKKFDFSIREINFQTRGFECNSCSNNCEVICILKENQFLDAWGNRCPIGFESVKNSLVKTKEY